MTHGAEQSQDALQLEALLLARAYWYALFNKLLGGTPDESVLEALLSDAAADTLDEFAQASDELTVFASFVRTLGTEDRAALLDRMKDEYTRVLIGPLALPASPYESPYTGVHDMATFQQNTLDVRALYHAEGLRVHREQAVPDDHVAILCAFAAEMSKRALAALTADNFAGLADVLRSQCAFVSAHLANWVGTYAASVRNSKAGAAAVLYPQLLEALDAFAHVDAGFLTESAYWAEGRQECETQGNGSAAPELAAAQTALEQLMALRPFGIQDNELIPIA